MISKSFLDKFNKAQKDLVLTTQTIKNKLIVSFNGLIDTYNSNLLHNIFIELSKETMPLIFNLKNLTYISSTGIAVFINLFKKKSDVYFINIRKEIMEVFQLLGFAPLIKLAKGIKTI